MNKKNYIIIRIIALALLSATTTAHGMKPSLLTQQLAALKLARDASKPVAAVCSTGTKTPMRRPSHDEKTGKKPEVKHDAEEIKSDSDSDKENSDTAQAYAIVRNAYACLERNPKVAEKTLFFINKRFKTNYSLASLKHGSFCVYPDEEIIGITIGGNQFFINYEGDRLKINPGQEYFIDSPVIDVYGVFDISHGKD